MYEYCIKEIKLEKNMLYDKDLRRLKHNQQKNYKAILDNQVGERLYIDRNNINTIKVGEEALEVVSPLIKLLNIL